jgi:hypothetical protein
MIAQFVLFITFSSGLLLGVTGRGHHNQWQEGHSGEGHRSGGDIRAGHFPDREHREDHIRQGEFDHGSSRFHNVHNPSMTVSAAVSGTSAHRSSSIRPESQLKASTRISASVSTTLE